MPPGVRLSRLESLIHMEASAADRPERAPDEYETMPILAPVTVILTLPVVIPFEFLDELIDAAEKE